MNRERFEQVNRLFIEAQHFAGPERQAFLDKACAGDSELRREVEALIEADREADVRRAIPTRWTSAVTSTRWV